MKMICWNVNGIRAALKKGFLDFLAEHDPDMLCLQEVKAYPEQVDLDMADHGYKTFWYPAVKKGYSGTAIFTKTEPISATYGLGEEEHDQEGRVITLEYKDYFLVTVYTPNSKRDLARLEYRQKTWDPLFLKHCKKLEKKKPVIFCGDLNVAHKEIDLARPKQNRRNAGFTEEEREGFDNIVEKGFIDTFREFCTDGDRYSWWSYMGRARDKNVGWRIDYFCISASLRKRLKSAEIHDQVLGSDHCPVEIEID